MIRTVSAFVDRICLSPDAPERGRIWADHISPVFDVEAYGGTSERDAIDMTTILGDEVIFANFRSPASKVVRSARKASKLGTDHIHIQIYRGGSSIVRGRHGSVTVGPKQMVVFDLSQSVEVEADPVDALALIVPRKSFQELVGEPASLHAKSFDIDGSVTGQMLYLHLAHIQSGIENIMPGELEAISKATLALCGSCIPGADPSAYRKQLSLKSTICRHIDINLSSRSLSVTAIAEKFGLSRSSLQRLFEAEGGFARYVRETRLQKAFKLLARSNVRHQSRTTMDIAFACGFHDVTSFTRSFAQYFGSPPRKMMKKSVANGHALDSGQTLSRWMSHIAGS